MTYLCAGNTAFETRTAGRDHSSRYTRVSHSDLGRDRRDEGTVEEASGQGQGVEGEEGRGAG